MNSVLFEYDDIAFLKLFEQMDTEILALDDATLINLDTVNMLQALFDSYMSVRGVNESVTNKRVT